VPKLLASLKDYACRQWAMVAAAMLLVGMAGDAAEAQEHCVQCSGPPAAYRCIVEGGGAPGSGKLECVTALAEQGPHEACSVGAVLPGHCDGPARRVSAAPGPMRTMVEKRQSFGAPVAEMAPEPVPSSGEPETVEALARRLAPAEESPLGQAGGQISKVGTAVTGAARKSWDCLSSLFKACGDK
jgi:hypothetical protein